MTAFRYRAARPDGELLTGTVQAGTSAAALQLVESRGLLPIELMESAEDRPRRTDAAVLATVLAGLAALLEAGMPADRALAAARETAPEPLRDWLAELAQRVREGAALSSALAATRQVPPAVLGYVRAGERSGALAAALQRAAGDLERAAETRARVRAALTYPAFLAIAGTASVAAIVTFVMPRFAQLLGEEGRALPASTRLLIAASATTRALVIPVAIALALLVPIALRWISTGEGRRTLHRWLLDLPLLGALRHRFATARFAAALAGLLEAGVPLLEALRFAGEAAADEEVARRAAAARLDVERGERLAGALARHAALTPSAVRLAAFGERAGRLPTFLAHAARLEETAAQRSLQRAVTLLEPCIILGFGLAVAFVAAALLQAVYSVKPTGL